MHIRDLVMAVAAAATACATNPDPRGRSIEAVQRDGHGGWIEIITGSDLPIAGELISIDPDGLRVLAVTPQPGLVFVSRARIRSAKLWAWETEHGDIVLWGVAGSLSTASHGFLLVFTFPIWVLTTTVVASIESRASQIEYPDDGWDKFAIWARFPQGVPSGLRDRDLMHQDRSPPPPPPLPIPGPAGEAGAGADAGVDAGPRAGAGEEAGP